MSQVLKEDGFTFACGLIDKANISSIRGSEHIGAKFQNAPILKLPGIRPLVIGRQFSE